MDSTQIRPGGRHPVDIGHLVMGVAFLGLVGVWALFEGGVVQGADLNWFLPIPWLAAGAAGLVALTVAARRKARRVSEAAYPAPQDHPADHTPAYPTVYPTEPADDRTDTTEEIR
jgi:hypothetical protein